MSSIDGLDPDALKKCGNRSEITDLGTIKVRKIMLSFMFEKIDTFSGGLEASPGA
jgi:hypothetical protein